MPTITTQILDAARDEKRQAQATYRELIRRFRRPHKPDGKRMLRICTLLGIGLAEIEADAVALEQMPALVQTAATVEERTTTSSKLAADLQSKRHELRDTTKKLEREVRDLSQRHASAVHTLGFAREAGRKVDRLAEKHWRAFGAPKPQLKHRADVYGRDLDELAEQWLADEPSKCFYPYSGNTRVIAILERRGYVRDGHPDVWALPDEPENESDDG